jgi:tripeptide aminopeptidase
MCTIDRAKRASAQRDAPKLPAKNGPGMPDRAPKPDRAAKPDRAPKSDRAAEPDHRAALALALELMAIPGASGKEGAVQKFVISQLRNAGAVPSAIRIDKAHQHTPFGGEVGNLIFRMPGTLRGPRRLLLAHLDTVPLCVGAKPVVRGKSVVSSDKRTGLGADDRGGCAVILTAALEIMRRRLPHPPLVFFWPVQEEVGLYGAHFANLALLGSPRLAFNWDGGPAEKLTVGATGAFRIAIEIQGLASHAGGAPEQGVSAITIAGLAIADLEQNGWLGDVQNGGGCGTSNIGVIRGGAATNVVTDRVELKAEARSHDPQFRREILTAIETAFKQAASRVKNVTGATGSVKLASRLDYEAFKLRDDEACVTAAEAAVRSAGGQPFQVVTNGGLDANWLTARGIPTVTLGCGQQNVHTTSERLDIGQFRLACRIALRLATAGDAGAE